MGKIPQGILGGVSGKVGGVVGSSWKGINVVKTKPLSVANPRTAGQIAQRNAFSLTVQDATALLSTIIKPLWDRSSVKMSGFNSFIKANIVNMTQTGPVTDASFIISKGRLQAPEDFTVNPTVNPKEFDLVWAQSQSDPYALPTDEVYFVARKFKAGNELAEGIKLPVTRVDGEYTVEVNDVFLEDDSIQCYLAFRRADGTQVSNTAYSELNT